MSVQVQDVLIYIVYYRTISIRIRCEENSIFTNKSWCKYDLKWYSHDFKGRKWRNKDSHVCLDTLILSPNDEHLMSKTLFYACRAHVNITCSLLRKQLLLSWPHNMLFSHEVQCDKRDKSWSEELEQAERV